MVCGHAESPRRDCEPAIFGPQLVATHARGREQVDVYPSQADAHQSMSFNKRQHFVVISRCGRGKVSQQTQHFSAAPHGPACEFTDHAGMADDLLMEQQPDQS